MIDYLKLKRALISVSDRDGLIDLCNCLQKFNVEIFASEGTHKYLIANDVKSKPITELTSLPSILDGRVKTLHPYIHSALLANKNNPDHLRQLDDLKIEPFDLLVVNFYPFEKVVSEKDSTDEKIIENIDIGGPTMVRSASKNFGSIVVLSGVEQYDRLIKELESNNGVVSLKLRRDFAAENFQRIAEYDIEIAKYFNGENVFNVGLRKEAELRYGENPHQKAYLYGNFFKHFELIHGKALSYNNILDVTSAIDLINDLEINSCAIIKHNNPCGVATGIDSYDAYSKALSCDPKSAFGGIVVFNSPINKELAQKLNEIFLEVIVLPELDDEVLRILSVKKDRRILIYKNLKTENQKVIRDVPGGLLVQDKDEITYKESEFKVVTKLSPTEKELEDLKFAWIVAKHVKSNAIVLAKDKVTLGIGAGQMSRVDSSKLAEMKAREFGHNLENCVLASDAFFPFADGLEVAVRIGAKAIIQPGGSVRDNEVIEFADKNSLSMIFTKIRHFKH